MRIQRLMGVSVASMTLAVAGTSLAQPGTPPQPDRAPGQLMMMAQPRLTEEEQEKIWTLQAHAIAAQYELDEERTKGLTELYLRHRQSYAEALEKMREEMFNRRPARGDRPGAVQEGEEAQEERPQRDRRDQFDRGRPDQQGTPGQPPERDPAARNPMIQLREQHQAEMKVELHGIMTGEQIEEVMPLIGSFSQGWDQMVHVIGGFQLDQSNQILALKIIGKHIVETEAMRVPIGGPRDPDAEIDWQQQREQWRQQRDEMRQKAQESRERLLFSLGELLNQEQLNQFDEATSRTRGRDRGDRGNRGGQRGGDGNDV